MNTYIFILKPIYMLILISSFCDKYAQAQCDVGVEDKDTNRVLFERLKQNNVFIKINLNLRSSVIATVELPIADNHTFQAHKWAWSLTRDSYYLRLPLDSELLSTFLLRLRTSSIELVLEESDEGCLELLPPEEAIVKVGEALLRDVISEPNMSNRTTNDDERLCRTAYSFTHYFFSTENGAAYRCCIEDDFTLELSCDHPGSDGWQFNYLVPTALLVFVYIVVFLKLLQNFSFALFGDALENEQVQKLTKFNGTAVGDRVFIRSDPDTLLCVGIPVTFQRFLTLILQILVIGVIFALFYGYVGLSWWFYSNLEDIDILRTDQEIYVNVFGHTGWILAENISTPFRGYAYFEFVYTLSIPILGALLYLIFLQRKRLKEQKNQKTKIENPSGWQKFVEYFERINWEPFFTVNLWVLGIIIAIWVFFIGALYLSYVVYFTAFAFWVNLDGIVLWVIPAGVLFFYITRSFKPLTNFCIVARAKLFKAYQEYDPELIQGEGADISIPRKEFDRFYIPRARKIIFGIIANLVIGFAALAFLYVVLLYQQWPEFNLDIESTGIVGANIAVFLPLLATFLITNTGLSQAKEALLEFDAQQFVRANRKARLEGKTEDESLGEKITGTLRGIKNIFEKNNKKKEAKGEENKDQNTDEKVMGDTTETSENNVETSANNVENSVNNADTAENNADTAENNVEIQVNNAETAGNKAETAENNAETVEIEKQDGNTEGEERIEINMEDIEKLTNLF